MGAVQARELPVHCMYNAVQLARLAPLHWRTQGAIRPCPPLQSYAVANTATFLFEAAREHDIPPPKKSLAEILLIIAKTLSFRRQSPPGPLTRGSAVGPRWGSHTPVIGWRYRARHASPFPASVSASAPLAAMLRITAARVDCMDLHASQN